MTENLPLTNEVQSRQLARTVDQAEGEVARQPRSPEENLAAIAATTSDLFDRIKALPADLPEDPYTTIRTNDYGGRGRFVSLKRTVVVGQDGQPVEAEHFYSSQVRSKHPDKDRPLEPGDPFKVSLSAESSDVRGLQFRMAGSIDGADGSGPRLRAMNQMTEMDPVQIQEGVDGILAELTDAVVRREQLAARLNTPPQP